MLTPLLQSQIKEYSLKEKPLEICGLIFEADDSSVHFQPCKNISQNKEKHFELSPLDYIRIAENNKIVGLVHSQRNFPSALDYSIASGHNIYSVVYSWEMDKFFEIKEEHFKYKEYLGLRFEINKQDCFTLVKNFYDKEYGIKINDYFRNDKWYEINPEIISKNYESEGFIELNKNEKSKEGDVFLFKNAHFGIYLEGDLFLSHHRSRNSNIEQLTDFWKERISNIYRHKSKM